jgi:uncharacterized caspase-like protein
MSALVMTVAAVFGIVSAQSELFVEQTHSIDAFKVPIYRGAISSKAGVVGIISTERALKLYDLSTFQEKLSVPSLPMRMNALAFSPSGQTLALGGFDGKVYVVNSSTGVISNTLSSHSAGVVNLAMRDETVVVSAGGDRIVSFTDVSNGNTLGSSSTFDEDITAFALQPNNKFFAVSTASGEVKIVDAAQLAIVKTIQDCKTPISTLSYSPDGKYVTAGTQNGTIYLWDAQSGALKTTFTQKGMIKAVAFAPKEPWLACASADSSLVIYDVATAAIRKKMVEADGFVSFVSFVNNETLITGTSKGLLKSWKVLSAPPDTTSPVITLEQPAAPLPKIYGTEYEIRGWAFDDSDIKAVTINGVAVQLVARVPADTVQIPAGMKAAKHFIATVKLDSVGINPVEIKAEDPYKHATTLASNIQRLSDGEAVEIENPANNAEVDMVSVPLKFRTWFDIASYSISVNMTDIVSGQVPAFKVAGDLIVEDIPIVSGYNQIQLSITSKSGKTFSKAIGVNRRTGASGSASTAATTGAKRDKNSGPQKWAVVVGVSEYQNAGIPGLKYADRDAESFANFLRTPEGGGYDSDHLRVLLNKDATSPNIKDALINFLGQAIDIDLVIIYFAGHGAPEPARQQNMYLLTYDSDPNQLGTTAFPMWEIQTVLARHINAKRVVVFTDACHSGNISVNFATRGLATTENNLVNQYLSDLSKTKEGIVVFTASAAGEVSQEYPEIGHGVFTYYLLEGMQGKADYNNDYTVTINELMQYVEEQVKRKTHGSQNPTRSQTDYDKEMTISIISH